MKKSLCVMITVTLFCSLSVVASPARNNHPQKKANNVLSEHQIENYVENIVATLFGSHNYEDQKKICRRVTKKLLEKTSWEKNYNLPLERTTQDIYQMTLGGVVDYVERTSFDLAKNISGDPQATARISKLIHDEIAKKITTTGTFSHGALADFIGKELENKVRSTYLKLYTPQKNQPKRYDEKKCRICFCHYTPSLRWLYLRPCGHDMCVKCAEAYFVHQGKKCCPVCGQAVDTHRVGQKKIYYPMMPWLKR